MLAAALQAEVVRCGRGKAGGDDSRVTARQGCPQQLADAAAPHSHVSAWDLVKKEGLSRGDVRVHSSGSTEADFIGSVGNPSSLCSSCRSLSPPSQIGTVAESLPFQVGRDALHHLRLQDLAYFHVGSPGQFVITQCLSCFASV